MILDNQIKYSKCALNNISFLVRNLGYCVDLLSAEYGFSRGLLLEYADVLNWSLVSSNVNIKWDFDLLYTFYDRISWGKLSVNPAAFKDVSLLPIFSDVIHRKDKPGKYGLSIACNEGLPWSLEFIRKYESKIDFNELSINESVQWSEELIDRYLGEWDLERLGSNEGIHWDLRLFEKYLDEGYFNLFLVKGNPWIYSDVELVEKYKDKVDWFYVSSNPHLPWDEKQLLESWGKHVDWLGVCRNRTLFKQDPFFYIKHVDIWDTDRSFYEHLSGNPSVIWYKELIRRYSTWWEWESLCRNEGVPWTAELIDFFAAQVCWGGVFDTFYTEDADGNSITPIPAKDFQYGLLSNDALPWSINFLTRYESKIGSYSKKQSPEIWNKVFKPVVDDQVVKILMRLV